jgi:hypothetical protein
MVMQYHNVHIQFVRNAELKKKAQAWILQHNWAHLVNKRQATLQTIVETWAKVFKIVGTRPELKDVISFLELSRRVNDITDKSYIHAIRDLKERYPFLTLIMARDFVHAYLRMRELLK